MEEITRSPVPADADRGEPGVEEGIVREPGDVDMGLILGIGFPPFRGGMLRWADTLGLPKVLEKLKKYESLAHASSRRNRCANLPPPAKVFSLVRNGENALAVSRDENSLVDRFLVTRNRNAFYSRVHPMKTRGAWAEPA